MREFAKISNARTIHARKGEIHNRFSYDLMMILIEVDENFNGHKWLGSALSIHPSQFGSKHEDHPLIPWINSQFDAAGITEFKLMLLTQPRIFGLGFNPVSFWFAMKGEAVVGFIAEVNNTFGERHFYLCKHTNLRPILSQDRITAEKIFYVSPFQMVMGHYTFRVNLSDDNFSIFIDFIQEDTKETQGVFATLRGRLDKISTRRLFVASFFRPWGGIKVISLIFYQALKLKIKGANYLKRPAPPKKEVSS